ncbi:MAG: UDP-N-acetylmuramate--alanine ligase [Burkholderiaceae bacterium]
MSRFAPRHADRFLVESRQGVRQEIATRAGRLIAEEGLDYASAKRKAARDILGSTRNVGDWLPDNAEVEQEVRAYQALFQSETQPARLDELRRAALVLMELLAPFNPHIVGAVLNGTAGEHSDIHLQLFCESPKDVQIFLLNEGIEFEVHEMQDGLAQGRQHTIEVVHFLWRPDRTRAPEGVHLELYDTDDVRGAFNGERRGERADRAALQSLVTENAP